MPHIRRIPLITIVASLLCHTVTATAQTAAQTRARVETAADVSLAFEAAARMAGAAVVEIFSTSYAATARRTTDLVRTERASGSGVVVDPEGYILTNAHVVRGAQQLRVELAPLATGRSILAQPGRTVAAELVGMDLETDLAVIKVAESRLPALAFGDSDELRVGQLVIAVGSPLGLQNSVSLGIVSAVARQLEPESPMVYVQTDAAISMGSSGGPLVDLRGRIAGINTLLLSQSGGYDGVGLAAPSNIAKAVYEQIRKNGRVKRGDIGIRAQTITPQLAAGLQLPRTDGVVLSDVAPGGMADRAGLRVGDVILTLDGRTMENGRQLQVGLYRRYAGDVVTLDVLRDGQRSTYPVAMSERQDPFTNLSDGMDPRQNLVPRLGILAVGLDRQIAAMLPVLRVPRGVVVVSTVAGAIDTREGALESGDVIYAVNRTPVGTLAELRAVLEKTNAGDAVVLHLDRRGVLMFLAFTAE
jgi:serine protease Do